MTNHIQKFTNGQRILHDVISPLGSAEGLPYFIMQLGHFMQFLPSVNCFMQIHVDQVFECKLGHSSAFKFAKGFISVNDPSYSHVDTLLGAVPGLQDRGEGREGCCKATEGFLYKVHLRDIPA